MRWYWFDRFTEFESGRRAVAIKNVSLSEEQIQENPPGFPVMPDSLIVEGLAQVGGLLVGEYNGFRERVVLAKISRVTFHCHAVPGDTLTYTAVVEDIKDDGAFAKGTSHIGDRLQAEMDLVFAHVNSRDLDRPFFNPADFLTMLRVFGLYDVGRTPNGAPLEPPAHLLQAERAANVPTAT